VLKSKRGKRTRDFSPFLGIASLLSSILMMILSTSHKNLNGNPFSLSPLGLPSSSLSESAVKVCNSGRGEASHLTPPSWSLAPLEPWVLLVPPGLF
jgi:hypothetical protein